MLNPYKLLISTAEHSVLLTLKESQLLEMLILRHPRVITKESIIEKLWGFDSEAEGRHVDTHMSLLRRKLKQVQSYIAIKTIRGYGYVLHNPNEGEKK